MTAKDEVFELAREGVEMHAPHAPEYKVCAALIKALAQRDELLDALSGIVSATTDGTCTAPLLNAFERAGATLAKYKREQP